MAEVLLLVGLAVAGGLSFMAWENPPGYAKFGRILFYGSLIVLAESALILWGIDIGVGLVRDNSSMIQNGHYAFYGSSPILPVLVLVGIAAFLAFLLYVLPTIKRRDQQK